MELSQRDKRVVIFALTHYANMSVGQIQSATGFDSSLVSRWSKSWVAEIGFDDAPRGGRPHQLNDEAEEELVISTKGKRRRSSRTLAAEYGIAHSTVLSILHREQLRAGHLVRVAQLTEAHRAQRRLFATKYGPPFDWRKCWISDEKLFTTQPTLNFHNDVVWDESGVRHVYSQSKFPPRVMFWGAISFAGKSPLVRISGRLDANAYIDLLKQVKPELEKVLPGEYWLQQDGAPCHTARATQSWCGRKLPHFIPAQDWPANSPDLSPIENLWANIDYQIAAANLQSEEELIEFVQACWEQIPLERVQRLILDIPLHLSRVLAVAGGWDLA